MSAREFERFSPRQRFEHVTVMVLFTLLAVTGLPQKFFEASWAPGLMNLFGGVDRARFVHRAAGLAFTVMAVFHLVGAVYEVVVRRAPLSIVPAKKDYHDAILTLRYYLGLTERQASFDRFDYRQKFEYWGLILGAMVVISTGIVLMWPVAVAQFLPGEVIPAAKVAHSNEGLLAFLVVVTWHIYNAHFNPDVFPFDTTIFTGRISQERMEHEHPLELDRLAPGAREQAAERGAGH
jgi:cytochrome b subunit of formate dehydrogenase